MDRSDPFHFLLLCLLTVRILWPFGEKTSDNVKQIQSDIHFSHFHIQNLLELHRILQNEINFPTRTVIWIHSSLYSTFYILQMLHNGSLKMKWEN